MRNINTVEVLGIWEKLNNPNFNSIEFYGIENQEGRNSFILTPKRRVDTVNAIGIITKQGRYTDTLHIKTLLLSL